MSSRKNTIADFSTADRERLVFIALGSNLTSRYGDPSQNILQAFERLRKLSSQPLAVSSLWQTDPLECPPGSPVFVNAVVALVTYDEIAPAILLHKLQNIEEEFGRHRSDINAPRPLDLDILAYGRERVESDTLTLPHPRATQRHFVLQPLAEIAPDYIFPGQSYSVVQLLSRTKAQGMVRLLC
jgi:2-amino-4-hydroxy-6-hydroxymethyldihydropteridine diphosphokinase